MSYAYKKTSAADSMFRVFNSLGQISFAFAGHAVALEIQATIPSTPETPSKVPMLKGAIGAYFINAICYFPVAFIGYWAFGQDVSDNVLMDLKKPQWLIASANLMVVIHVIGSYQVCMYISNQIADRLICIYNFSHIRESWTTSDEMLLDIFVKFVHDFLIKELLYTYSYSLI